MIRNIAPEDLEVTCYPAKLSKVLRYFFKPKYSSFITQGYTIVYQRAVIDKGVLIPYDTVVVKYEVDEFETFDYSNVGNA